MAKIHTNNNDNIRSLVLDGGGHGGGHHFRLWTSFSGSAFRRKIFDAVSCGGSSRFHRELLEDSVSVSATETAEVKTSAAADVKKPRSEKLLDLLNLAEAEVTEAEREVTRKKEEALEELKRVVADLQTEERIEAAKRVRLLAKDNAETRVTLAMLGAIPPLAGMLDDDRHVDSHVASLYALLNLSIGNDLNKGAIVKAGVVHKMLKIIESQPNPSLSEAIVANFLGLSALDSNKPIIGSSGAVSFLVDRLKNTNGKTSEQERQDALRSLYNLSICQMNISYILETDLIPYLLSILGDMELSERILAILSNIVSIPEGRKAISSVPEALPILVDVINWSDSPGCQEKVCYVLMVMAHKSYGDRQAMIEAGISSALLELTLLGTTLAQKRASRILDFLRVDKGKQVSETYIGGTGTVSAPIEGGSSNREIIITEEEDMMSQEKKAVKQLVQQSLQNNMRRIVKRANLPQDFVPSEHFKSLTVSSTSKSLPF